MAFLQDLYGIVNFGDPADAAQLQASVLPPEPAYVATEQPAPPPAVVPHTAGVNDAESDSETNTAFGGADSEGENHNGDQIHERSSRRSRIEEVPSRAES
jgi:hypothetical protein